MTTNKQERKQRPIASGVLAYFPDAIAEVAYVSYVGNQQHNPGEPLHWSRGKSTDHADCAARHLLEHGKIDDDGLSHTAKLAWRALALLQTEIEQQADQYNLNEAFVEEPLATPDERVGSDAKELNDYLIAQDEARHERFVALGKAQAQSEVQEAKFNFSEFVDGLVVPIELEPEGFAFADGLDQEQLDWEFLIEKGCDPQVAEYILAGTTYQNSEDARYVYISGPMRGINEFNFPKFDMYRDAFAANGYNVISPADIDRAAGFSDGDQSVYVYRDFYSLLLIAHRKGCIHMLEGHEKSTGATAELALAKWLGIEVRGVNQ